MKKKFSLTSLFIICLFAFVPQFVFAAKSPTPRITEVTGASWASHRVHFEINPVKAGEIIKVNYKLSTSKFNDVKYKIPKKASRSATVNAAASAKGSAVDLFNLVPNYQKFIYNVKVKVQLPNKTWSSWSNTFSF